MDTLTVTELEKTFGKAPVLDKCSVSVREGEILGLIGPNGSGKSTLLNVITGYYACEGGNVLFEESDITNKKPFDIARAGIGRTFQTSRLFKNLSVLDNLLVISSWFKGENTLKSKAEELLEESGIPGHLWNQRTGSLSGGQQRLVEIAMAMIHDPRLLLLDEPLAGLHPTMVTKILDRILSLKEKKAASIMLVSHSVPPILPIVDRLVVLVAGRVLAEGRPESVVHDERVIDAYLGG